MAIWIQGRHEVLTEYVIDSPVGLIFIGREKGLQNFLLYSNDKV